MIKAEGVEKRRGELTVQLSDFRIGAGRAVALVGPSGCGKSTVLDLLAGTLTPDRVGALIVAGHNFSWKDSGIAWRARSIGYVLQTGGLIPSLSVAENILLPRRLLGVPGWGDARGVVDRLGITNLLRRLPAQLSIGERQRVAIARALAHDPQLVLADEPTAALDPNRAQDVLALLSELVRGRGRTLVMVTHDANSAARAGLTVVPCRSEFGKTIFEAALA